MRELTLFTAPKSFDGPARIPQMNALRSWTKLRPRVRLLLFGDEPGIAEVAREIEAEHLPHVERSDFGTPLISSLFRAAHDSVAPDSLLAWLNADIVLLQDFRVAVDRVRLCRFVLAGRRRNVPALGRLVFEAGWDRDVRARARRARLEAPWGSDYFVFPADGTFRDPPPFVVGRARWDNWVIGHARREGVPVVDATRAITAVHEPHGYDHIPGFTGTEWGGPESRANDALARERLASGDVIFHLWDATHVLTARGVHRTHRPVALWRRLRTRHSLKTSL